MKNKCSQSEGPRSGARLHTKVWPVAALLLTIVLLCAACSGRETTATTMKLADTEGTVGVRDEKQKDLDPAADMNLYSGYQMDTKEASYAWLNLDSDRLAKMDQTSALEIQKSGKDLELLLQSGNLYFNIEKPLEDDETMDIRTSSLTVGIRGTCGWVEKESSGRIKVYILEGKVACTLEDPDAEDNVPVEVSSGEMALVELKEGTSTIFVKSFSEEDIPPFVLKELSEDDLDTFRPYLATEPESTEAPTTEAETTEAPTPETPETTEAEEVDPETLPPEQKIEFFMDALTDGKENVFEGNVPFFGQEIQTITIDALRDLLVGNGLAESRLMVEPVEGLGRQLMYSGDMTAFLDMPVSGHQLERASFFTSLLWIKNFPEGTPTGILDICAGDSIETVLTKMGFVHAAEIGQILRENPGIRVRWSSYSQGKETWSVQELNDGDKVSDDISFSFDEPMNKIDMEEIDTYMEMSLSTMYKNGNGSSNRGNMSLYFNSNYAVSAVYISQMP